MNDSPECGNCRFFVSEDGGESGECHRYPPTVITDGESVICVRPTLEGNEVPCGEWKPAQ